MFSFPADADFREKTATVLANTTFLFAGFGVASFVVEMFKIIDIIKTISAG